MWCARAPSWAQVSFLYFEFTYIYMKKNWSLMGLCECMGLRHLILLNLKKRCCLPWNVFAEVRHWTRQPSEKEMDRQLTNKLCMHVFSELTLSVGDAEDCLVVIWWGSASARSAFAEMLHWTWYVVAFRKGNGVSADSQWGYWRSLFWCPALLQHWLKTKWTFDWSVCTDAPNSCLLL